MTETEMVIVDVMVIVIGGEIGGTEIGLAREIAITGTDTETLTGNTGGTALIVVSGLEVIDTVIVTESGNATVKGTRESGITRKTAVMTNAPRSVSGARPSARWASAVRLPVC